MTPELENLITWAETACEDERARVGFDPDEDTFVPSWLPELEAALLAVEDSRLRHKWGEPSVRASATQFRFEWFKLRECKRCGAVQRCEDVSYDRWSGTRRAWRPLVGRCKPKE